MNIKLTYKLPITVLAVLLSITGYGQTMPTTPVYRLALTSGLTYAMVMDYTGNAAYTNLTANSGSLQVVVLATDGSSVSSVTSRNSGTWSNTNTFNHTLVTGVCSGNSTPQYDVYRFETSTDVVFGTRTSVTAYTDTLFYVTMSTAVSGGVIKACGGSVSATSPDNCIGGVENNTASFDPDGAGGAGAYTGLNVEGVGSTQPLPVDLLSFSADWQGEDAVVEWETASELNNSHFDVERSFDGSGFEYIGTVGSQATGGNSNQRLVYTYTDLGAKARTMKNVFYRLIQTDFDGASEVFGPALLRVNRTTETSIALFPVPAQNQVTVQTIGLDEGVNYTLRVIGNLGNTVQESTFLSGRSYNKTILDISSLPSGVYRVTVEGGNLQGEVEKFIKID